MTLAAAAFLSALVGSPHCAGMCGPFALAACRGPGSAVSWQSGKLLTYVILGGVAGAAGEATLPPGWIATTVSAALIVWFSAVLAGLFPEPRWASATLERALTRGLARSRREGSGPAKTVATFAFGVVNGLLPCGLVYAALGLAVASGSAVDGAITMSAFGLGTVPALTAVGLGGRRISLRTMRARRLLAAAVLITGLGSVVARHVMTAGHDDSTHAPGVLDGSDPPG